MELILGAVIMVLCTLLVLQDRNHTKEKNNLINALIAKTPQDKAMLDTTSQPRLKESFPDLIPSDSLSDEEWEKAASNI